MIARVLVDINLPQVDRLFDFHVPESIQTQLCIGQRVRVQYGKSKKATDGFVVALATHSDFAGELRDIESIVSPAVVLTEDVYQFVRAVADRQVVTAAEVVKNAVPVRSVRVETAWLEGEMPLGGANAESRIDIALAEIEARVKPWLLSEERSAVLAELGSALIGRQDNAQAFPVWAINFVHAALLKLRHDQSSILCLPDFRDIAVFQALVRALEINDLFIDYGSALTPSKRYSAFLTCLGGRPCIVVGNRSAIYAPVAKLSLIAVWDDDDESFNDQSSPYCSLRDLALLRQNGAQCNLLFAAHSRSVELQRLIEIGYLKPIATEAYLPSISASEATSRISPSVFSTIKAALSNGPVLVQVSATGQSTSLYCGGCSDRANCRSCNGPLWVNASGHTQCRWCSALNDHFTCPSCSSNRLRTGKPGSARTLEQFGAMLPNVPLREFTADNSEFFIDDTPRLVVATPGSEPYARSGYAAVVILDAKDMLARDTMTATTDAIRLWFNAISKVKSGGKVLIAGLGGPLSEALVTGDLDGVAARELSARRELGFPPALRLASIEGERDLIAKVAEALDRKLVVDILGPTPVTPRTGAGAASDLNRLILRFNYASGASLASHLREIALRVGTGQTRISASTGRNLRPIRIKMDDRSVL